MPLQTACKFCSAKIKVKDELIGKSIKCPKCGKIFKTAAEAEEEKKKTPVPAGAVSAKKPAAAWDKDGDDAEEENEESSPWDKKGKESNGKKKPAKKAKDEDDDDEDEDDEDKGDSEFKTLLAATLVPDSTKKQIQNELGLREVGVWVGQPDPKMMTVRAIPKSLAGFAVAFVLGIGGSVMIGMELSQWALIAIPALILVLILFALAICGLVLFMERRKALHTAYVITNKRCIVYSGKWFGGPGQESFYPDLLQHMRRMGSWVFGGDAGDLVFRSVTTITTTHSRRGGTSTSVSTVYYGFLAIRNLDEIEQKIRTTLLRDDDDDDEEDDDEDEKPKKKKKKKGKSRDRVDEDDD